MQKLRIPSWDASSKHGWISTSRFETDMKSMWNKDFIGVKPAIKGYERHESSEVYVITKP